MYSSVKLSCPYEVRKSSNEPGDSKASKTSQRVSDVLMGPPRSVFPLKQIRRFAITSKAREMHRGGAARYHLASIFGLPAGKARSRKKR